MSIKTLNVKVSKILAISGAFISGHSCNGGRTLKFFRKRIEKVKSWVVGVCRQKQIQMLKE